MRRLVGLFVILALLSSLFLGAIPARAITGWNAGRIINDNIFTAHGSMSTSAIQSFLNSKVPTCDTYGKQLSEHGGPDLNGDGKVQRWEWGKANYNQTKFTCLKNWKNSDGVSAAQIIYNKSQKYKISPKVLLVLLQKEQSLVTDTWPLNVQYRTATGYGCPDTAPCDSQYYGLTNQLDWAAKMFRAIMDDSPTWYTPYELGKNYIQYNPSASCGGSTVNIENRATQALYNYTPYQPNKAALDAGWGSAPCGAYGNRNFFLYFSNWFGRPNASSSYSQSLVSRKLFTDSAYTNQVGGASASIKPDDSLYAEVIVKNTGNQVWYKELLRLGASNPRDRISPFKDASWLTPNRPTDMSQSTVTTGGQATFRFKVTAPSAFGSYTENFAVLVEGKQWLKGQIPFYFTVTNPDPVYAVETTSLSVYRDEQRTIKQSNTVSTYSGSKLYITAKVKNTGNRDLPATQTKLAPTNPRDRISEFSDSSWISGNRVDSADTKVAPGQTATFAFSMTVPEDTGSTTEQFGIVIDSVRWVDDTVLSIPISVTERPPSLLSVGQSLNHNDNILSPNERFSLVMQTDGNLVLYSVDRRKALWHTRTAGKSGARLVMQSDGNLVLYSTSNKALWHTRTAGKSGARLVMQSDGNLVLYSTSNKALWHTRTAGAL